MNGDLQPTDQNVLAFTRSFLLSKGYDTTTFNTIYNYETQHFGSTILHQNSITMIANLLYSQDIISVTADNYLSQLSNYLASFAADSISIPTQASYNSFANNLIATENQFSGNYNLTSNDKYILFSAYSVARYSTVYAIDYSIQLSSPSESLTKTNGNLKPLKTSSWFSWGSVGKEDVSNAIGGAAGGALVGSAAGGVGAGPGAVIGGIGGGVAGSVTNAAEQLWDHLF